METKKDSLTNEKISKKFRNQFELVNYAIKLAENMIRTGRDPRIKTDTQNRAMQIITEIVTGKDAFDDIPVEAPVDSNYEERRFNGKPLREEVADKPVEKKKGRKILAD